ncbi:MAG: iron ABC transporter permease [Erysipelotrichaceae bacterium]|nr:iron ABC transporter permease [Erysipelotrichaceae bacterium]
MTEIKKQKFKNNLKAYFSKPANIITVLFLVLLIAAVVVPLFALLIGSFKINGNQEALYTGIPDGSFTIAHWKELLTSKDFDYAKIKFWEPLYKSCLMALLSCVVAVGFGGTVAWFITRSDLPFKKFISTVFVFPYIMPAWSMAMFWENFFKNTAINAGKGILQTVTGICVPESVVYGFFPCAMCLGLHYAPFAYILIGGILRNMDANLEEAATVLKASRLKILTRVTLPIVMPALISTVLLVFSSSISAFTVPFFLNKSSINSGNNFISISVQMRSLINSGFTKGQGYVIAIVLMIFSLAIITLNNWFTGKRKSFTTVTGKSGQVSLVKLGKARNIIAVILVIIVAFFAIMPMVSFAMESLLEVPGDMSTFTLKYWLSTDPFEGSNKGDTIGILRSTIMWSAMGRSLLLSLLVSLIAGTFGILIGYAVSHKRGSRAASLLSDIAFLPYLIPAMSFGAVYLALSYTKGFTWLDGSFFLLLIVGAFKFMPFASRTGTNAMLQLSGEIEEAALITGTPWWKRMTRVLFPIQKSSFMSGYLLPFISCMREMSLFVLLAASYTTLVTTVLQEYSRTGLTQASNAINLLIIVFVLVIQFVVNKLTGASIDKGVGG